MIERSRPLVRIQNPMACKPDCPTFAEFQLSRGLKLYVCAGRLSPFDIIIRYRTPESPRVRTPSHIHWTVDALLKLQSAKALTAEVFSFLHDRWPEVKAISGAAERANVELTFADSYPSRFDSLDSFGYYPMDFLMLLAELLMKQEKTNRSDAYMFPRLLKVLSRPDESDLYRIISAASYFRRTR